MLNTLQELEKAALEIRKKLLKLCSMQVIHIGGDLSIADIMTALWQYKMNYNVNDVNDETRDRFVLSKGHASAVTAFNQAAIGCFSEDDVFDEYAADGGRFSMHSCNLVNPYVEVSTGSLGHGMPVACGMASALRLKGNKTSRVYTILGDGEHSEGSIWEAIMNAAHYHLGNLVAIVDYNKLEADGSIDDLTALSSISEKYRAFGWMVFEFNGNDMSEIMKHFDNLPPSDSDTPIAFVCHTTKGKGVPFMENQARWHAGKITTEQLKQSIETLEAEYRSKWGIIE